MNENLKLQYKLSLNYNEVYSEWWWTTIESLNIISSLLLSSNYVIIDNFLLRNEIEILYNEVLEAKKKGLLSLNGIIGGGRNGKDISYENPNIRSDILGYFDGIESNWLSTGILQRTLDKMNTLVCELRDYKSSNSSFEKVIPELSSISTRSRAMITCYPGNGSHYNKHCDNPLKNGRKLTCILYLNKEWKQSDGGQLKMFHNDDNYILIDPLLNRLVIFWSDIRCLHEVLPAYKDRYAITLWFIDSNERNERNMIEQEEKKKEEEEEKIIINLDQSLTTTEIKDYLNIVSINESEENNSCVYQIQYPGNSFQNTELYVNEDEIKLLSNNNSFNEFHISLSQKIIVDKTIAKFHRKTCILSLTVFYL